MRPSRALVIFVVISVVAVGCTANGDQSTPAVAGARAELGEPTDGFPSWEERVIHVWTNRARADPATDLAPCAASGNCAEHACYSPVAPLVWNHDLARLARFHSDNLTQMGCWGHDSPCQLQTDISTRYTPGPCNGSASCACASGGGSCGGSGSTDIWTRFSYFGISGGARAENIASNSSPTNAFYAWLHERDTSSMCGWRVPNGHRHSILNGSYRSVGVGKTEAGSIYTQDFHSSGTPNRIVAGVHHPETGSSIEYRANWYAGSAPAQAQVNVDGTCTTMTLERGTGTNGTYLASVSGSGCRRYYFHFRDGTTDVFYPTTGSLGVGCGSDYETTRPPVCGSCTPSCGGAACGDDGCGGSCGSCGAGETCMSGSCVPDCTPSCSGRECGGDGCGGSCGSCGAGRSCASGTCECSGGTTECAGGCVDTDTSRAHCGGCGVACAASESCVSGTCTCVPSCGGRECGGDGCGGSCGSCSGGRVCSSGSCECGGGLTECGGSCVDVRTSDAHCGACGAACGAMESCVAGSCVAMGVDAGVCMPACDGRDCGDDTCGGSCGTCSSGEVCGAGGVCSCGDSATDCGGACVDTRIDAAHCGACDVACAAGESCVAGACEPDAPGVDGGVGGADGGPVSTTDGGLPPIRMDDDGGVVGPGADEDRILTGECACHVPGGAPALPRWPLALAPLGLALAVRRRDRR